jgi:hypothetical protein
MSSISDKQRSHYRPICVDSEEVRDILPIKQVPCAVVIYVDGQVARYEGASSMDLVAHLTMLYNQVEKMSAQKPTPTSMRKNFLDETERIQESHAGQGSGSTPISALLKAPPSGGDVPSGGSVPSGLASLVSVPSGGREAFAPDDFLGNGSRQNVGKPMEFRDVNQDSRPVDLPRTTTKINVSSIMNEFERNDQGDVQESPQRGKVRKTNTEGMQSERTMIIAPSRKGEGHSMLKGASSLNMIEKQTTPPPDEKIPNTESLGGEDLEDLLTLDTTLDTEIQANIGKKGKDANSKQRSEEMIRQREELEQKINNAR